MEQKPIMKEEHRQRFQPVVDRVMELLEADGSPILVAIDGMSASGKSTLGAYLEQLFHGSLFHMDDFFLQDFQRTPERMAKTGGNVDYERFQQEVLSQILKKRPVAYRPFRCDIRQIQPGREIPFRRLNLIEGSYSQHPYFGDIYQLRVFTEISKALQEERIQRRNGSQMLQRFATEWIPKENAYFEQYKIKEGSEVILRQGL